MHLDKPAPAGGVLVFLSSANPLAATVPASVRVPAGASQEVFALTLHHAHDGPPAARLTATYGGAEAQSAVTVLPIAWQSSLTAEPAAAKPHHDHSPQPPAKPPGR
ncbi:MAG TPA: hypothetical protein VN999_00035 [Thermoanaerobaculia bacterium]|nr:hypothetical protein [Thermoanaerobaculia bacterium]